MHYALIQVVNNAELLEIGAILNHILFNLLHLVIRVVINFDRHFIGIIVQIDEAVIEEETTVAFLSIAVIHLLTSLDVVQCLNNETSTVVCIVPGGLSRALVIEHVSIGHKTVSLDALNLDTENT